METKDRIRMIMEEQHMTQQVFADFLQQSPATLSSIFNGRTRPTLNVVDAIKTKIPDINIEWLLYGTGDMHISHSTDGDGDASEAHGGAVDQMLNFDNPSPGTHPLSSSGGHLSSTAGSYQSSGQRPSASGMKNPHVEFSYDEVRAEAKDPRRVTEIRIYYDDQTYETFLPAKK